MKAEEIVRSLRWCGTGTEEGCDDCAFEPQCDEDAVGCVGGLCDAAADKIEELVDRCARYAEEIAELRERQKWIPVTERLPEGSVKECIVFVPHIPRNIVCLGRYLGSGGWVIDGWYLTSEAVAYWMPLPEAPHEKVLEATKK